MATAFILSFFVITSSSWSQSIAPCGQQLSAASIYQGVPALSNGTDQTTENDCVGENVVGPYGDQYQCVEYVRRFYSLAMNVDTTSWQFYNADQYYKAATTLGLIALPNGGSNPPAANDIVVFEGGPAGHAAVATAVSPTAVNIIEQNWSYNGTASLVLTSSNSSYVVSRAGSKYVVLGWLREGGRVVYAPSGQVIFGFPLQLILDPTPTTTNGYSITYSSTAVQYTVAWNSTISMTSLYDTYKQYLPANGWTITNDITNYPTSRGLYAQNSSSTVAIAIVAQGSGSQVSLSYLTGSGISGNPAPTVTQLNPASLPLGAAPQILTINGAGFVASSTVTFNGIAHTAIFVTASQLTISLTSADLATVGSYPVVVTNPSPGGGNSNAVNFTVSSNNPVPAITQLNPASVPVGATPQTLAIIGTGFLASSTVTFNATAHAATFVSATQLTISLTSADLATPGSYPVVVTNPLPGGGASNAVNFTVSSSNPVPAITQLNPASLSAGATPQAVTIIGTGFLASSTVTFNGIGHAAVFVSASQLTISLTSADLATAGSYPVVVTNPTPGGGASNSADFTVTASVSGVSVSPSSVSVPEGGVQTFTAVVSGGGSVTWSVEEGAAGGTITTAGIYTAPISTGIFHVVATNSADTTQTATATVTVSSATSYSILYSFTGAFETASLIQAGGSLYGTNEMIAFKIDASGTFTQLAELSSSPNGPISPLILAKDDNFYGTTSLEGANGLGSIFRMSASGNVRIMYSFAYNYPGETGGAFPWAGLIQGIDGNFYGTTYAGGSISCEPNGYGVPAYGPYGYGLWESGTGCGTVFRMDSTGNVTVLYSFSGQSDGSFPSAPLIQGSDGNFYGTTSAGGAYGYGTIFEMDASGSLQVLHSFSGADGSGPVAGLLQAADGNLYGTTSNWITSGGGEIFKVDTSGNNFTILHTFSGPDGSFPVAPLIQGSDGSFYGTTWAGGDLACGTYYYFDNYPYPRESGCGTVFRMDSAGNVTILHAFEEPQTPDGDAPYAGLLLGQDGNLYGTTYSGGTSVYFGAVFRVSVPNK